MVEEVISVVKLFAETIDSGQEVTIKLLEQKFPRDGKKYFYLMPIAFGWVVLSKLGAEKFPNKIQFNDCVIVPTSDEIFVSCLKAANGAMSDSYQSIDIDVFDTIVSYGAEGKMANQLFKDGESAKGAVLAIPLIDAVIL